ncbi:MAG: hypothetical protein ACOYD7_08245 [Raoultibacter sp.]|jgi:hypothetical protein
MVQGIAYRVKKYVDVIAKHDSDGNVTPLSITWEDGRSFEINRILDRRQAASLKVGGNGMRFLVRVGETETFLFYEGPKWFVEAIVKDA